MVSYKNLKQMAPYWSVLAEFCLYACSINRSSKYINDLLVESLHPREFDLVAMEEKKAKH